MKVRFLHGPPNMNRRQAKKYYQQLIKTLEPKNYGTDKYDHKGWWCYCTTDGRIVYLEPIDDYMVFRIKGPKG